MLSASRLPLPTSRSPKVAPRHSSFASQVLLPASRFPSLLPASQVLLSKFCSLLCVAKLKSIEEYMLIFLFSLTLLRSAWCHFVAPQDPVPLVLVWYKSNAHFLCDSMKNLLVEKWGAKHWELGAKHWKLH